MQSARRFDAGRVVALAVTLLVHATVFGWLLIVPVAERRPSVEPGALQVVWIERPVPEPQQITVPLPDAASAPLRRRRTPSREPVEPRQRTRPETPATEPPPPAPGLSAVFIEQGKALDRGGEAHDFARNPLGPRARAIDAPVERIRMREPMSAARVVEGIGLLFGGAGYEEDPCPRILKNMANLSTGGNSELLQEEVRRHKQFCEQ